MKRNLFGLLLMLVAISCDVSNDVTNDVSVPSSGQAKEVYNFILDLGIKAGAIQEFPDRYVAEGDIIFMKDMVLPERSTIQGNGRAMQKYTTLISLANETNIKIKIDASMTASPNMSSEISSAVSLWNDMYSSGSGIRMSIVSSGQTMTISNSNLGSGICGQGTFPSGGAAGTTIFINKSEIAGNSYDQRRRTIAHELGHTIGFVHINEPGGTQIAGTPTSDASSIMNGGQCGFGATVPSTNDVAATVILYPTDGVYQITSSGNYPQTFTWHAPLYTGNGAVSYYETKYVRYDYTGNPNPGPVTTTTGTSYVLPFTQGQYTGQSAIASIRPVYANGAYGRWNSQSTTL